VRWTTDEFTGRHFGKYEVLCRLAVGGMAEIFLGFARTGALMGKPVVLKRILTEQREDPTALQNLIDEAKLTATLSHPNVAQVLDLDIDGDDVLLVIEFISGANLEELVEVHRQRNEPVPLGFALTAVREAAQGLAHAHSHRNAKGESVPIIHRDVTPRNVMTDFEGLTRMLDFGIARVKGSERRTQAGMVRGTTAYMSPEQAIGKELDHRSDLFSLGIICHELLTGTRLFYKGNPAQEMAAVYEAEIPLPSRVNKRVPRAIDPVVMRLLERKVDRRYQSAIEFTRDLSQAAGSTAWAKDRCAELIRQQFAERQKDTRALTARIPAPKGTPSYPGLVPRPGAAQATPLYDDDEAGSRTQLAVDPLSLRPRPSTPSRPSPTTRPSAPTTPSRPVPRREASGEAQLTEPSRPAASRLATDAAGRAPADRGPATDQLRSHPTDSVTDSVRANDPGLSAEDLFGDGEPIPERTHIVPNPSAARLKQVPTRAAAPQPQAPARELESDPEIDQIIAARNKPRSSGALIIAAVAVLVLGGLGGAFLFKSMQGGGLGRVIIHADRPVEVVLEGQALGTTPVTGVFPAGHHRLQFRESGAPTRQYELDVKANVENLVDVTLDSLDKAP
jgi:serine/threonine protein kinase